MKKYFKYVLSTGLALILFGLVSPIASAKDTITYKNSYIYDISNAKNTLDIISSNADEQMIYHVPVSVRAKLMKADAKQSHTKRYNITVSTSNRFVKISKAPNHKNFMEKIVDNALTFAYAPEKPKK